MGQGSESLISQVRGILESRLSWKPKLHGSSIEDYGMSISGEFTCTDLANETKRATAPSPTVGP